MFIVGHRGARALEPENTLRAIRRGMGCADYVEIDARMTNDGRVVVIHDPTLDRTTDGTGEVKEYPFDTLREFDAGLGERIPALEEVSREVKDTCGLFVEIKEEGSEEDICRIIRDSGPSDVYFVSFHQESLSRVKELLPGARTGLIFSKDTGDSFRRAITIKTHAILPKFTLLSEDLVTKAHKEHLQVIPWTLNGEPEFARAQRLGVDGFATDDPCKAREFFKGRVT
ncbi:glycerophosphoryl diester phosphodiesterase [Methanolinea mesophila]|uniref:glycerophosphodiester phosphodiesterase n=1 Tax=Methanolinea mesophila TaxID=547055 RepID=UPI001AE5CE6D|nr:glycerophosphodiester phosphodiesterase family protein [Methanolinea mesophila]MBP1929636.1 glycerophosphoryl diester phosphodiesterase [Methanolinea mesophila]